MEERFIGTCYVGHLHPSVSEADLFLLFSQVHPVHSVRVVKAPVTKESRGYGYVNYAFDRGSFPVAEAIKRLNYTEIYGQQISVMVADREQERRRRSEANVFVKGLDGEIDSQTLHDTFDIFGPVTSAKVARTSNGRSLGYGYVQFLHVASAEEAIKKANNMMLKHRTISVEKFKPRQQRRSDQYTNLFVKHLPSHVHDEEALGALFKPFGAITSVCLPTAGGNPKGFGFVNYEKSASAKAAVAALHEKEMEGAKLYVQRAQSKAERRRFLEQRYRDIKKARERENKGRNVYVKNFPLETTDADLFRLFSAFGKITSAKVMYANEKPRGFGFVCFSAIKEASAALNAMHGYVIGSKRLYVNIAQSMEERKRLLRKLRSGMPIAYPAVPYYYPSVSPMLSTVGATMEYSQVMASFAPMPCPVPAMLPPTMPQNEDSSKNEDGSAAQKWDSKPPANFQEDPELLELGYALYGTVSRRQPNPALAQKITGMLIDLGKEEVKKMANDEVLTATRISESLAVLNRAGYFGGESDLPQRRVEEREAE